MTWFVLAVLGAFAFAAGAVRVFERTTAPRFPRFAIDPATAFVDGQGAIRFDAGPGSATTPMPMPLVRPGSDKIDLSWLIEAIRIAELGDDASAESPATPAMSDSSRGDVRVGHDGDAVAPWMLDDTLFSMTIAGMSPCAPMPELLKALEQLQATDDNAIGNSKRPLDEDD